MTFLAMPMISHLRGRIGAAEVIGAADGIGVGEIEFGEVLADDGDFLRRGGVLWAEGAAGDDGNPHSPEIAVADDIVVDVGGLRRVDAGHGDVAAPTALVEGKGREADGGDAVDGGDALLNLLVEGDESGFRCPYSRWSWGRGS